MRALVLTSQMRGFVSLCLPRLHAHPDIDVCGIVLARRHAPNRWRLLRRRLRKTRRIGVLGALNGIRLRGWFDGSDAGPLEPIDEIARRLDIPLHETPAINTDRTRALFRELAPDIALSLGNAYIAPSVFTIPRLGMLNVHHESLPAYRGALSVIWRIHEGETRTGFAIHEVEREIDAGRILHGEELDIEWRPTLEETVRHNNARVMLRSADALATVLGDYDRYDDAARAQPGGRSFTTPTFGEYRRMVRQHARLSAAAGRPA